LPGGDPLAAALAAGDTPSPELVAAAGGSGVISQQTAVGCLAAVIVGLLLYVPIAGQISPSRDLKDGADFFAKDARVILEEQGHYDRESPPAHVVYGFRGRERAEFWYRQSPTSMTPHEISLHGLPTPNVVTLNNPPLNVPNMVSLRLDSGGALREFVTVPGVKREGATATSPADWNGAVRPLLQKAFQRAGLQLVDYGEPQPPHRNPPFFADVVWEFRSTETDTFTGRVEVAALNRRIVYFHVIGQDEEPGILAERELRAVDRQSFRWISVSLALARIVNRDNVGMVQFR
jgi:serine/threonine-protein kinase